MSTADATAPCRLTTEDIAADIEDIRDRIYAIETSFPDVSVADPRDLDEVDRLNNEIHDLEALRLDRALAEMSSAPDVGVIDTLTRLATALEASA